LGWKVKSVVKAWMFCFIVYQAAPASCAPKVPATRSITEPLNWAWNAVRIALSAPAKPLE
jgi:hypothetical protein